MAGCNTHTAEFFRVASTLKSGEVAMPQLSSLGSVGVRIEDVSTQQSRIQDMGLLYQCRWVVFFDGNFLSDKVQAGDRLVARRLYRTEEQQVYEIVQVAYDDHTGYARAYIREWI
ncbi:hypothetical protein [Thermogutta sp.]|uniref:hypothetical protein n=1 Tax=Thermogutta sp. TaxID=1962930 RepID=UPI00321F69F9